MYAVIVLSVSTTNESQPPTEVNNSVYVPGAVKVCVPNEYVCPVQIDALAVSLYVEFTVNVRMTNESQPLIELNNSVYVPGAVRVCIPNVYVCPVQIEALAVSLYVGFTINVRITVESQPPVEVNSSVYVPGAVKVCVPNVYVCPVQIEALAVSLYVGFTVNVRITVESQPPAEVNSSVYVPGAVRVCVPNVYVCPVQIVALAVSLYAVIILSVSTTNESQPPTEVNSSVYVPAAVNVCVPKMYVCPVQIDALAVSL